MRVLIVAGARPNFMKIAPIYREARKRGVGCKLVHTGQHYDTEMSGTFFEDLDIPVPDFMLNAGAGSHAVQTARIMVRFEKVCLAEKPQLLMTVGDVNSTLACSIVAKKLGIQVAHVEAGLRSGDMAMPEEINRIVTDSISDYFFVTEESGIQNLLKEAKRRDSIHFVGNVMIDNLLHQVKQLDAPSPAFLQTSVYALKPVERSYAFLTLHRPSNVDRKSTFEEIAEALNVIAKKRKIFFPMHPRTKKAAKAFHIQFSKNIVLLPPLSFKESLYLWKDAEVVLTDSGGLQEETTALGVPCVTIRENTERPITVEKGTNVLAGTKRSIIIDAYGESIKKAASASLPRYWDGKASHRIWEILMRAFPSDC